jgi:hypothetical protein
MKIEIDIENYEVFKKYLKQNYSISEEANTSILRGSWNYRLCLKIKRVEREK